MKAICLNSNVRGEYSAPECRVFSVDSGNNIAQTSPGTPGGDDDYNDYEDD